MKKIVILLAILGFFSLNTFGQHFLVLKNGKKIECVVMSLNNDTLEVYINLDVQKIALKEVSAIYFAQQVAYDGKLISKDNVKTIKSGNYEIIYKIKGRTMIKAPVITNATEKKGRVVVKIEVDKYGNVLKAKPGYVGSTTTDKYLLVKAMKAAKDAKFNVYMKGPIMTEGLITIEY